MEEQLRELVSRLNASQTTLAGLCAVLAARISGQALPPPLAEAGGALLRALGVEAALAEASTDELRPLLGQLRTLGLCQLGWLRGESLDAGWVSDDPALLNAAGEVSVSVASALALRIAPQLAGLAERLSQPTAACLDVGVGVAALSIALAERWPQLAIVGIDPLGPALALARERVAAAGLTARISLRQQRAEALRDEAAFDLAWIPGAFLPREVLGPSVARVHTALRPGGWLLLPVLQHAADPLTAALQQLRALSFGGCLTAASAIEELLREQGFVEVRTLPSDSAALTVLCVGRRSHPA